MMVRRLHETDRKHLRCEITAHGSFKAKVRLVGKSLFLYIDRPTDHAVFIDFLNNLNYTNFEGGPLVLADIEKAQFGLFQLYVYRVVEPEPE